MQHALNDHVAALHTIEDNVIADWVAPQSAAQVVARSPEARPIGKKIKTFRDFINLAIGNCLVAALKKEVLPDFVEIRTGAQRQPVCHPSA